ncbi:MAG: hypothetical protein MRQ13_05580 [Candidatus Midichloria sp.]|nr:hypothetical protein [Candidatus Midichloria sp.]
MITPPHIVSEWYFLPFYAILRSIPDKLGGVIAYVCGTIVILFLLPWLDGSKIRSANYRPLFRIFTLIFIINFIVLGYIRGMPPGRALYLCRSILHYLVFFISVCYLASHF